MIDGESASGQTRQRKAVAMLVRRAASSASKFRGTVID